MNGFSKLVSVVIVLAISITLAIAVSYLVLSLFRQYTRVEVIASSAHHGDPSIIVIVKNLGSKPLSITDLYLNKVPVSSLLGDSVQAVEPDITKTPLQVKPGEMHEIRIDLNPSRWGYGEIVEVLIMTGTGNRYYAMVNLS